MAMKHLGHGHGLSTLVDITTAWRSDWPTLGSKTVWLYQSCI